MFERSAAELDVLGQIYDPEAAISRLAQKYDVSGNIELVPLTTDIGRPHRGCSRAGGAAEVPMLVAATEAQSAASHHGPATQILTRAIAAIETRAALITDDSIRESYRSTA